MNQVNYFRNDDNKEIDFILPSKKIVIECKYINNIDINDLSIELNKRVQKVKNIDNYKKNSYYKINKPIKY